MLCLFYTKREDRAKRSKEKRRAPAAIKYIWLGAKGEKGMMIRLRNSYFPCAAGFGSFFFAKLPLSVHSIGRLEPHPSTSWSVTEDEVKISFRIQGSPSSWYSAEFADLIVASPLSSPA